MSTPAGADSSMEALSLSFPRRRMEFAAKASRLVRKEVPTVHLRTAYELQLANFR
jgi:hypothetical protein